MKTISFAVTAAMLALGLAACSAIVNLDPDDLERRDTGTDSVGDTTDTGGDGEDPVDEDTGPECIEHDYLACAADGNVHSYDSCDNDEGITDNCPAERGVCVTDHCECTGNWDIATDCTTCASGWAGDECEKVTDCSGLPDFTLCDVETTPDRYWDICVAGACVSPGCGDTSCNAPGPHWTPADTNQRDCYDAAASLACPGTAGDAACGTTAFCGQDAQYGWDTTLPASARFNPDTTVADEPVVEDNVTGLAWTGCVAGLTGINCTGGSAGPLDWDGALAHCEDSEWGGFDDWRLPDRYELFTLVDHGLSTAPTIDIDAFPETGSGLLWSSSSNASVGTNAWAVDLATGESAGAAKADPHDVLCVRGGDPLAGDRWAVDTSTANQPVVTDASTGLTWQGCASGLTGDDCTGDALAASSWEDALVYCEALDWGGSTDWRLPSVKELQGIVNSNQHNPAIAAASFPATPTQPFWTSTTDAADPAGAWALAFSNGVCEPQPKTGSPLPCRCVSD